MLSANTDPSAPQAYLNYLMFDQNLQLIPAQSGTVQVPTGSGSGIPWTTIRPSILDGELLRIDVPGYIIIYINNNSIGKDVYFDDIKIEHYNGNVLEESHYYPFGLTVSQMASGATAPENPYKYNTKELETTFGLQSYDYGARMYNSQIGRWYSIDPLAEVSRRWSPYNYAYNNPIRFIDPDGRLPDEYYDYGGHYLGSDGTGTDRRLISKEDFNKANNDMTILRGASRVIQVKDDQQFYRHMVYAVGEEDHQETNHGVIFNTENATLGLEPLPGGEGNENSAQVVTTKYGQDYPNGLSSNDATVPGSGGTKVIVGILHPHPTPTISRCFYNK